MRILYVEDNAVDAELTEFKLKKIAPQFKLEMVSRLSDALVKLKNHGNYDLVLLDLQLPDGNGLELLTLIRDQQLSLAVIILTGSGDQDSVVAALKAGADDYLTKEVDYLKRLPETCRTARNRFLQRSASKERFIHVLYAEPNPLDVDLTRRHIKRYAPNIHLEIVDNSEQILSTLLAKPSQYDLLLLDYNLPTLDALELVKKLRNEHKIVIPTILVTGHGNEAIAAQAIRLDIDEYVVKHDGYLFELVAKLEKVKQYSELVKERSKLQETSARLSQLIASSPVILYKLILKNKTAELVWVSDNITVHLGYSMAEALEPHWWFNHLHREDRSAAILAFPTLLTNKYLTREYRFFDSEDNTKWILDEMKCLPGNGSSDEIQIFGAWHNITDRKLVEEELRRSAAVFEATRDGVLITDLTPRIISVNPAFTDITGYTADEVLGKNPRILSSNYHDKDFFKELWLDLEIHEHWQGEIWNRRKNGEIYPQILTISIVKDEQKKNKHYVGVFTDISQLKQSQEQLQHLAHFDPLTELPNRLLIQSRLDHALELARRHQHRIGVLFVDLDHFKTVNDSLGHPIGDELLIQVARRMNARLRDEDSLGRLGGDEFLVLLEQMEKPKDAVDVALSLINKLQQPFILSSGQEVFIGCSIGISLFPDDADSVIELIQHADSAMYLAKHQGRNTYRFYTEDLTIFANQRLKMETNLRRALERNEFILHYQPLIDGKSGLIVGAEALVRWLDPEEGMIAPDQFIPLAEETGLIVALGQWVLQTACQQAKAWLDNGKPLVVAVNLSPVQFKGQDIVANIHQVLADTGLPANYLELEITESTLMEQGEQAFTTLFNLKTLGVSLAVDDFGTGYSSLAYLRLFPLDKLKIDRSFVDGLGFDENDQAIVKAIIAMAHSLGLKLLAEGVETKQQKIILNQLGCEFYQGYLFSKPVSADQINAEQQFDICSS